MGVKVKLPLVVLLVIVCAAGLALATTDLELKQCKHQCKQHPHYDKEQRKECERKCEDYYRQKQEREREGEQKEGEQEREREKERRGYGEEDDWVSDDEFDPQRKLSQCEEQCERQFGQQRYGEGQGGVEEENSYRRRYEEEEEEWPEQERGGENPYVFREEHFLTRTKTEHGRIDVLQKFTERSKLLSGINNFRVGFLEANPQTFISPTYLDADVVLFVARGRGTLTTIGEGKRESFNFDCGDVMKVPAGTPMYMINRDSNDKLFIVQFFNPFNLPGHFEPFLAAGGEEAVSFYTTLSDVLLEAAFKTDIEKIERVFRQRQGVIVKASREQIQALSHHEEGPRIWPFTREGHGPFNIFHDHPVYSNNYGQLFEVHPDDFRQLKDLNLVVSFANITQGSMAGPYFNSKSTKISVVVDGEGYFEMACPHISSSGSRTRYQRGRWQGRGGGSGGGQTYHKIRSELRRGTVFIIPAGHPVATVASPNSNLKVLCFEINGPDNVRYPLAGRRNFINELEREAKELAFGVPAKDVDQVFKNQKEEFFFPGPGRQFRHQGRAEA